MTQLYRIEEDSIPENKVLESGMTKEECKRQWEYYLSQGYNPSHLKIVRES